MFSMTPRKTELDTEIERLHGLPLGEFTAARNALAKRLRKGGDADAADAANAADYVQALPKPTASAWAVNELFQREPEKMESLLAAGRQARSAQGQTIAGRGAEALRTALREARALVDDLRRRAVDILSEAGRAPGGPLVDRVGTNLQALAFSPAAAEAARRGWLSADLDPPGFEVLAGLQLAAVPERKPTPKAKEGKAAQETKEAKEPKAARKREEREEEARKRDAEKADRERREREEEARRERVKRARAGVQEAESRADFLRRKAEQAGRVAEEASRRAEEAGQAAAEAQERFEEAEAALAQAREELEAADGPKEKPSRPQRKREGSR